MTEQEWASCDEPHAMLAFRCEAGWCAAERHLRHFACACVRRVWHLLQGDGEACIRRAVEAAERHAGRLCPEADDEVYAALAPGHPILWAGAGFELTHAVRADAGYDLTHAARTEEWGDSAALEFAVKAAAYAFGAPGSDQWPDDAGRAALFASSAEGAAYLLEHGPGGAAARLAEHRARLGPSGPAAFAAAFRTPVQVNGAWELAFDEGVDEANGYAILAAVADARRAQAALVREVFGPQREVAVEPSWLAWGGGTPLALARAIYDEREFGRLPVLADALEDAGCDEAELLAHLRGPGPHVLGCWALDAVLGER